MPPLLALKDVHTHIGQFHILHGVSFDVRIRSVTALLGRNGAGKTTTLRTIMGLWRISRGQVTLSGEPLSSLRTADVARRGVGYVPENMGIFGDLTVRENMILAARRAPMDQCRLERLFVYFPPLEKFWGVAAGHLSGGQKQMLSIARGMIERHDLLLIDEPTKGVAPGIIEGIVEACRACMREGTTILLVEQNFDVAAALADDVVLMEDGRISFKGTMEAFRSDAGLGEKALGLALRSSGRVSSLSD